MATARLKYNSPSLPALTDRDGEDIGNWVSNGNHTITSSADFSHAGTKSLKIVATDVGDDTTNNASLANTYNHTFVSAKYYCITFWIKSLASTSIKVKTGGTTSATLTTTTTFTAVHFKSSALS